MLFIVIVDQQQCSFAKNIQVDRRYSRNEIATSFNQKTTLISVSSLLGVISPKHH
jgi:hypothetical protein